MVMTPAQAVDVASDLFQRWHNERRHLDRIDRWSRWDHDQPHRPKQATAEYRELSDRAQAPWGDLIVSSIAQTLYVEGYRRPSDPTDSTGWRIWQANGMDGRQVALHRAVMSYGYAFAHVAGGVTLTGEPMPALRCFSPRDMFALFADPVVDEWPVFSLRVIKRADGGYDLRVLDAEAEYRLDTEGIGSKPQMTTAPLVHDTGVTPVVRFTNRADLEGRVAGEIEPFIPVLGKIDQTSFDRLVVQRFASWIVRTIAGMSVTESAAASEQTVEQVKMRLRVEDMLTAEDPDTRFGSLPATPLDGFIKAHDSDLTVLAAVSQTPAYELLGQMANLSAEALAAARASLTAKSDERKHTLGEEHERMIRLACHVAGDADGAADFSAQVRWADTTIRSLSQAVDAYGKLVQMLGMPPEVLWPKVPGMTQQDIDEAKSILEQGTLTDQLIERALSGMAPDAVDG